MLHVVRLAIEIHEVSKRCHGSDDMMRMGLTKRLMDRGVHKILPARTERRGDLVTGPGFCRHSQFLLATNSFCKILPARTERRGDLVTGPGFVVKRERRV